MGGSANYCIDCGKEIGWLGRCVPCAYIKSITPTATGPAPKEKEMTCKQVEDICHDCGLFKKDCECKNIEQDLRTAERCAIAREAYMAALGGGLMACAAGESWPSIESPVEYCTKIALETIRRWDAFMAAVDAEDFLRKSEINNDLG